MKQNSTQEKDIVNDSIHPTFKKESS